MLRRAREKPMKARNLVLFAIALTSTAAFAEDYSLFFSCSGDKANMEVYLPKSLTLNDQALFELGAKKVQGFYALDLNPYGKGKPLEPVLIGINAAKTMLIVDQYTRGLPPTAITLGGGGSPVEFDKRFGTNAICTRN